MPRRSAAPATGGVFAAYTDATYNSSLASIDSSAIVTFGSEYTNGKDADLTTPGLIKGTGA